MSKADQQNGSADDKWLLFGMFDLRVFLGMIPLLPILLWFGVSK